ncbi:MAG: 8-oxoguanine deaminase [Acidimicrobiia bacterium]|nr:8-oxoguanine deaminase [Acidimicrobiia bacterium]
MPSLLIKNALVLATMDDAGSEIAGGGMYIVDGFIEQVGNTADLPGDADEVVDLSGHAVVPGLINTHHHLFQTLTRAVPGAQDAGLFGWLTKLYPIWSQLTPDHIRASTRTGLAELALSGCTTVADHLYLFPNGSRLDDEIEAAATIGLRLHASRGSMSRGESAGGLPPDSVVEDPVSILEDTARVAAAFDDPDRGSMVRIVVAPCSPFSVSEELMAQSANLARELGLHMHTHLAETMDEEAYCVDVYGKRPLQMVSDLGWEGTDVWYAHSIFMSDHEIAAMGRSGTGVAHCPSSNMRLASGIAPVRKYRQAGVPVGIGVDGSASNDGNHMLGEARQAMLLARLDAAPSLSGGDLLTARDALRIATRGGAEVLGRADLGSLEPGKAADFVAVSMDRLEYAGAHHDPLAALLFAAPTRVDHVYVHGNAVVSNGELATADVDEIVQEHNRLAAELSV